MGYKVILHFFDLQDFNHEYHEGDIFPRSGLNVSEERLRELAGSGNKLGKPVIQMSKDDFSQYMNPSEEELPFVTLPQGKTYTKTEINRMTTAELKVLAKGKGIDNAEDMTGGELKKVLIETLGL